MLRGSHPELEHQRVLRRVGVGLPAGSLEGDHEVAQRGELPGAPKDHVLEEVGQPALALPFVAGPAPQGEGHGDGVQVLTELDAAIAQTGGRLEQQISGQNIYTISLPLTLAIIRVMMTKVGHEVFAFPIEAVRETLRLRSPEISLIRGSRVVELRDEALSLLFLREVFEISDGVESQDGHVLIVSNGTTRVGIVVDHLQGIREVVIKPLSSRFSHVREISGSAILGDDQIINAVTIHIPAKVPVLDRPF